MKTPSLLNDPSLNRRLFLQRASAGVAVIGASPWLARAAAGANERINIGCIGTGGRASALMGEILALAGAQNVRIVAVCDVWQKNLQAAAARVKQKLGEEPKQFTRFAELLAMKEVDAVTIATPDFSHGAILTAALKAGKDVYIEKPMTIDLASANEAFDLARAKQRVVQAGTQRRSDGKYLGAAKVLASGALGTVSRFSVEMNFNESRWLRGTADCKAADVDWDAFLLDLPKRDFDPKLLRQWQLYRATSNGLPGLWMTHFSDTAHLVTGAKYPTSAVAHGGIYVRKDGREHTDTFVGLVDYPEGFLFSYAMGLGNAAGTHCTVHGTKATLDLEKWTVMAETKGAKPEPIAAEPNQSHMGNWLECLRSRQRPNADIQFGHQHAVATIMTARALETGRRQKYDPATRAITEG
ncbi:MAG: Gfo/Idh/MocA family oxidoreductase [Verrucomicrobia bacterium]|nr:Gfo/Idh/MocA family oxidoreductase [Verrucomicrobiota bacterium]